MFFGYSYFLILNYVGGDQASYRALYEALSITKFLDVPFVAEKYIIASDWLSFYLLWMGAVLGINKDIYIALANTLMLLFLCLSARKSGVNYPMIALLMCNYYVIVLMTSAERLKFAFIFLFLAVLVRQKKWKILFYLLSVFAHLQSLILLASVALNYYKSIIWKLLRGGLWKKGVFSAVGAVVLGGAFFYIKLDSIEAKFKSYSDYGAFVEVLQIAVFMLAGLFFIKNKFGFFVSLLVLIIAAFLVGGHRVNMIAVFFGVYLFWIERKGNHPFLYVVMIYFAIKSMPFVLNILNYGNGFHEF